jgi:hypothetical protein
MTVNAILSADFIRFCDPTRGFARELTAEYLQRQQIQVVSTLTFLSYFRDHSVIFLLSHCHLFPILSVSFRHPSAILSHRFGIVRPWTRDRFFQ